MPNPKTTTINKINTFLSIAPSFILFAIMQTEATQHDPESFTHPRKNIFLISLAQRTSLGPVA
jgi:hypothetical protein